MSERKVTLIIGKRGSGKSYLARHLLQSEPRSVVFDTMGEYTEGVMFGPENFPDLLLFWKHVYRKPYRIIYRPIDPEAEIGRIAENVFTVGNVTLLVEEVDCFVSPYKIDPGMAHIIQRGRHNNISLIGVTQRPFGIHRLLSSQAKKIMVFNTNEPRDREYLRMLLGQEIEGKLDQLKQYEFVEWSDETGDLEIRRI